MVLAHWINFTAMEKSLTQITFEFSSLEEASPVSIPIKEPIIKQSEPVAPDVELLRKVTRGRKSLKATVEPLLAIPEDDVLFSKQYYTISEVANMFGVNQSLIRFWENEFDILQPKKNKKGDRYFRPVDIKNLQLIHDLLRRRKFTIEGAREYLRSNKKSEQKFEAIQKLEKLKAFLLELKANL